MTRNPRPRQGYQAGVSWIAENDEPEELNPDEVAGFISTSLLAYLMGKDVEVVAEDIVTYRSEVPK